MPLSPKDQRTIILQSPDGQTRIGFTPIPKDSQGRSIRVTKWVRGVRGYKGKFTLVFDGNHFEGNAGYLWRDCVTKVWGPATS